MKIKDALMLWLATVIGTFIMFFILTCGVVLIDLSFGNETPSLYEMIKVPLILGIIFSTIIVLCMYLTNKKE